MGFYPVTLLLVLRMAIEQLLNLMIKLLHIFFLIMAALVLLMSGISAAF